MEAKAENTHDWATLEIGDAMLPTDEDPDGYVSVYIATPADIDIEVARFVFDRHDDISKSEALANAQLFIAAGKLLNALNELLEISKTDAWGEGSMRLDDALADARAVVAAATKTEE